MDIEICTHHGERRGQSPSLRPAIWFRLFPTRTNSRSRARSRSARARVQVWVRPIARLTSAERLKPAARAFRCHSALSLGETGDSHLLSRTSEPEDRLATPDVVRSYKNLTNVERAFRSLKTVDLQIRPIRHRAETRVRSHLFLCLLAYYLQWHLRRALAPLLFDDEDLDVHRARRDPVLKAEPSASAKRKKTKREAEDGLPLHSFKTLMAEMATRARHQCRTGSDPDGPRLQRLTEPTPL